MFIIDHQITTLKGIICDGNMFRIVLLVTVIHPLLWG